MVLICLVLRKFDNAAYGLRKQVLSPLKVLQSATVNAAKMLQQDGRLGRIYDGYCADMLVLNKNPLDHIVRFDGADDFLLAVIKEGRVVMACWDDLPLERWRPLLGWIELHPPAG